MRRLLLERAVWLVPTLLLATFGVFWLIHLAPGDPAITLAGENATARQIAAIRHELGLDQPFLLQYWHWLTHAWRGNLGTSLNTREGVAGAIGHALPVTLQLVLGGLLLAAVLGTIAGIVSARRAGTSTDAAVSTLASAGAAIPSFWLGLVLISMFALGTHWFPATGSVALTSNPGQALRHLVLPSIALGVSGAAEIARQLRAVLIDILGSDHIRTLRAKGLSERRIVWLHALKGAAVPLMTIVGLQVSRFLGAAVVVEAVFGISGIGSLVVGAAQNHDYPVVEGVVVVMALIVIVVNFAVDVSYRIFDPRIR
ncbi:MAG: ABC transporter permease [Solirubrobacterales bacterium]|nr:ABC transporter permease [Solirubrobacterales bacterium]